MKAAIDSPSALHENACPREFAGMTTCSIRVWMDDEMQELTSAVMVNRQRTLAADPQCWADSDRTCLHRSGAPVQMMQLNHGIFDEASVSVIAFDTVREIGRLSGRSPDVRRFRPNVVVRLLRSAPFQEDEWVGGVLSFGDGDDAPAITVTMRDVRCSMVNLDPDSASPAPEVLKAVVRANQNNAGIYGGITRIGRLGVGQTILLHAATEKRERG